MTYLEIIKQKDVPEGTQAVHATSLRNEIDEIDEIEPTDQGVNSSISSISSANEIDNRAVERLRRWQLSGVLDRLPDPIPGFGDELAQYSDRACLIGLAKAILDVAMWSLTACERAVQFVDVLTPLIEGGAA